MGLIKYGKTGQLRGVLASIIKLNIYYLKFKGTVKVHGTNAGITITGSGRVLVQSRNNFILGGHFGFYNWVMDNAQIFLDYRNEADISSEDDLIIYGEWAGEGIQSGVGVSTVPKFFYIFKEMVVQPDQSEHTFTPHALLEHKDIEYAHSVGSISINPNDITELNTTQLLIEKLVTEIENDCPVAKARGGSGIGEGIVWVNELMRFKTKGQKHSVSKVKTNKPALTPEQLSSISEFVEYAVTDSRFNQALQETDSLDRPMRNIGKVISWINKDIHAEELDVIEANLMNWKQLCGHVTREVKRRYI